MNINPSSLRLRAVRVDITLPERLLDAVDRYAKASGKTRSGLLAEAVTRYMGREGGPRRRPRRNQAG